ncbi:MAG: hypothetical protein M1820_004928 [Bogoriella megaspora]|nr:MAG: hypothetical protein M1820_004928 [Bogoriella megaspora]
MCGFFKHVLGKEVSRKKFKSLKDAAPKDKSNAYVWWPVEVQPEMPSGSPEMPRIPSRSPSIDSESRHGDGQDQV